MLLKQDTSYFNFRSYFYVSICIVLNVGKEGRQ